MKTAEMLAPPSPVIVEPRIEPALVELDLKAKLAAFVSLTKPRIALMVLVTVAVGFVLGAHGAVSPVKLLLTLVGTAMVAGGASAWNMILERDRDARMRRTTNRALPCWASSLLAGRR